MRIPLRMSTRILMDGTRVLYVIDACPAKRDAYMGGLGILHVCSLILYPCCARIVMT